MNDTSPEIAEMVRARIMAIVRRGTFPHGCANV